MMMVKLTGAEECFPSSFIFYQQAIYTISLSIIDIMVGKCVGRGETRGIFGIFAEASEKFLKSYSKQIQNLHFAITIQKNSKKIDKIDKMRRHTRTDNKIELKILEQRP